MNKGALVFAVLGALTLYKAASLGDSSEEAVRELSNSGIANKILVDGRVRNRVEVELPNVNPREENFSFDAGEAPVNQAEGSSHVIDDQSAGSVSGDGVSLSPEEKQKNFEDKVRTLEVSLGDGQTDMAVDLAGEELASEIASGKNSHNAAYYHSFIMTHEADADEKVRQTAEAMEKTNDPALRKVFYDQFKNNSPDNIGALSQEIDSLGIEMGPEENIGDARP